MKNNMVYHESQLKVLIGPGVHAQECVFEWKKKGRKYNPVDPPPEQFEREIPPQLGAAEGDGIPPTVVYARSDELWKYGLVPVYPRDLEQYGVHLEDWKRFVEDVTYLQGRLGWRGKASYLGLGLGGENAYGGYLIYLYFRKKAGKRTIENAKDLVDVWNEMFFNPRGVNVQFQTPKEIEAHIQEDDDDNAPSLERKKKLVYYMGQRRIPKERCRFLITSHRPSPPPSYPSQSAESLEPSFVSEDSITLHFPHSTKSPFSDIHAYEEETLI